jgi:hypothetical protein
VQTKWRRFLLKAQQYQAWNKAQKKYLPLTEFTREELLQVLMDYMDVLDKIDSKVGQTSEIIERFIFNDH